MFLLVLLLYYTRNQCYIYIQVFVFQLLFSNILTEIINRKIEHNFENIQTESQQIQAAGRYRSEKKDERPVIYRFIRVKNLQSTLQFELIKNIFTLYFNYFVYHYLKF